MISSLYSKQNVTKCDYNPQCHSKPRVISPISEILTIDVIFLIISNLNANIDIIACMSVNSLWFRQGARLLYNQFVSASDFLRIESMNGPFSSRYSEFVDRMFIDSSLQLGDVALLCKRFHRISIVTIDGWMHGTALLLDLITQYCPNLKSLMLKRCSLSQYSINELKKCHQLNTIHFEGTIISMYTAISGLSSHQNIKSLSLRNCTLGPVLPISPFKNLEFLDLSFSSITDILLQQLVSPTLKYLILSSCNELTDISIVAISTKCKHLQRLDLRNCKKLSTTSLYALTTSTTFNQDCKILMDQSLSNQFYSNFQKLLNCLSEIETEPGLCSCSSMNSRDEASFLIHEVSDSSLETLVDHSIISSISRNQLIGSPTLSALSSFYSTTCTQSTITGTPATTGTDSNKLEDTCPSRQKQTLDKLHKKLPAETQNTQASQSNNPIKSKIPVSINRNNSQKQHKTKEQQQIYKPRAFKRLNDSKFIH